MLTRLVPDAFLDIIGCSGQEYGRVLRTSRNQDDSIEFDTVAHRNHRRAPDIIKTLRLRCESRWYFALELRGGTCFVSRTERRGDRKRNNKDIYAHIVTVPKLLGQILVIGWKASATDGS